MTKLMKLIEEGVDKLFNYDCFSEKDLKYSFLIVGDDLVYSTDPHDANGHAQLGFDIKVINSFTKRTSNFQEFHEVLVTKLAEKNLAVVNVNGFDAGHIENFEKKFYTGMATHARVWVEAKVVAFRAS